MTIVPTHQGVVRTSFQENELERHWVKWKRVLTHTHTFSGKADHGGAVLPPHSYARLARWAEQLGIDAIGMGSPYTPKAAATYREYNRLHPERYYDDPAFDHQSLRDDDEISRMLREANALGHGRTLFYLDNETPKGRYGHLWWVGYHCDFPAWHDYDTSWDKWMCTEVPPGDDGDEPMAYRRRPYRQIVAIQRRAGALGFWAHPTSWWRGDDNRFITNIASEMPAHAIADGYLDGMVIMGYRSWRPEYQNLWFSLLDAGFRVTGVAEADEGLSREELWATDRTMLNHVPVADGILSQENLIKGFASGRLVASNGPHLDMTVDTQPMGSVVRTSGKERHHVTIWADPLGVSGRLDLVGRGGRVVWQQDISAPVRYDVTFEGSDHCGYLLPRFVAHEVSRRCPAAVGNPVYLHPQGSGFAKAARTVLTLAIGTNSPFHGGQILFEHADGDPIGHASLPAGVLRETLPASGRFTLIAPDGQRRTEYLINANTSLTELQRYLYRGRFLRDFPAAQPGEVPVAAWQLEAFNLAMREMTLER